MQFSRSIACLFLLASQTSKADAVIFPGPYGGHIASDPAGIEQASVTKRTIVVDVRPVADGKPIHIEATYEIEQLQPAKLVLFVVTKDEYADTVKATLDDRPLEVRKEIPVPMPAWRSNSTQASVHSSKVDYRSFSLDLKPGKHHLVVGYSAEAAYRFTDKPSRVWGFEYNVRHSPPAGSTEMSIQLPAGWECSNAGSLARVGDELAGRLEKPVSSVTVETRFPSESSEMSFDFPLAVAAAGMVLGGIIGLILGMRSVSYAGLWGTLYGVFLGIAVIFAALGAYWELTQPNPPVPTGQECASAGLGDMGNAFIAMFVFGCALCLVPLSAILFAISAKIGRRKSRPKFHDYE